MAERDGAIRRLRVSAYTIPTDGPEADGTFRWDQTTLVLVEATADGITGIGYTYADRATARFIHDHLEPVARARDPMDTGAVWVTLWQAVRNLGRPGVAAMAISAVDVAVWDLKARLLGRPLVQVLGAARAEVEVYGSGGFTSYGVSQLQRQLGDWVREGIGRVKMKVGTHPPDDLDRVRAAREGIGNDAELFVDANGAYSRKQALAFADRFAELGVRYFEEPVSSDDLEGLRLIRDRGPAGMDIAAGEYGYQPLYFRRMLEAGAVDILQADASRCGGVTGFLKAGTLAEAFGVPLSSHCAPALHVHPCCGTTADFLHLEYFHDHVRIETTLFEGAARPVNGALRPDPSRPGLGIEFKHRDADRLQGVGGRIAPRGGRRPGLPELFSVAARVPPPRARPENWNRFTKEHGMSISLTVLRGENERTRFERLRRDDSRTAIPSDAARSLEAELRKTTTAEVRFDAGSRALYSTDGSNYRQTPIGVVIPRTIDDVVATVAAARRHGAPIFSRGGGTSLAGQCCNVAVVMDFSKHLYRVLRIDGERRLGVVQPGCVLDSLRDAAAEHAELMFAPDPATHNHCTLGGMLGNDSCGAHSLLGAKHGKGLRTADNTHEMEVLTYDGARFRIGATSPDELDAIIRAGGRRGEIYARLKAFRDTYADDIRRGFPKLARRVSGYNLDELLPENDFNVARALVGSESTLVTILEATLELVPNPKHRSLLVLGYPSIYEACEHLLEILEFKPTALEGIDQLLFEYVRRKGDKRANLALLPDGKGFLLVEFSGESKQDSDGQARRCMARLQTQKNPPGMRLYDNAHEEEMLWKVREGGLGSTAWVPGLPDMWPGWEDSAVPVDKVDPYLRDLRALFDKYDYHPSLYGHFGQGCIHCRVGFDLYTPDGIDKYKAFMDEATSLVIGYGGSLSGEHGDGQARGQFLPKMFGDRLYQAMIEFKGIWDPDGKMNPGKKVGAYPIDVNLRLGSDYHPPHPPAHFQYPNDRHSFARAALRCVGVGECRREGGQTMCPSYMVTREEKHCTRGRSRLLFEMLNGEVLTDGWREEAVKDALDLCLACKGCKHDCPVNVDMATYKAEFMSHYYEGRVRPRHAYSMGLIHTWAKLASVAPGVANFFSQTPGLSTAAKWAGGLAPQRTMPPFATETFKAWFGRHRSRNPAGPPVLLWPDTFTNFFHPDQGRAAVAILEDAGFRVLVPRTDLCCGRPLYDFGMLDTAKSYLRQILRTLQPLIGAGVPVVGLEPSCTAVFRDELAELFPDEDDAKRLHRQTFAFSEFLNQHARNWEPPHVGGTAIVHVHCHHKSVIGQDDEFALLKKLGIDFRVPEAGCCGLAGSFGFEAGHYDVSMAVGERNLLPAVRGAAPDELLIANGFSCETQIEQGTGRRAQHVAQVIASALRRKPVTEAQFRPRRTGALPGALLVGGAAVAAGLLVRALTRRHTQAEVEHESEVAA